MSYILWADMFLYLVGFGIIAAFARRNALMMHAEQTHQPGILNAQTKAQDRFIRILRWLSIMPLASAVLDSVIQLTRNPLPVTPLQWILSLTFLVQVLWLAFILFAPKGGHASTGPGIPPGTMSSALEIEASRVTRQQS